MTTYLIFLKLQLLWRNNSTNERCRCFTPWIPSAKCFTLTSRVTQEKRYHLFLLFCLSQFSRQLASLLRPLHFRVRNSISMIFRCGVSATCRNGTWRPGRTRTRPTSLFLPSFSFSLLETRTLQYESSLTSKSPTAASMIEPGYTFRKHRASSDCSYGIWSP